MQQSGSSPDSKSQHETEQHRSADGGGNGASMNHDHTRPPAARRFIRQAGAFLLADIKKLRSKIRKLAKKRSADIERLNAELQMEEGTPDQEQHWHPLNQYDNKRLTQRGEEICFRLFDKGKSPMAVAHLMGISLKAARKRHGVWRASGGAGRLSVDLSSLPERKFYRRYDDD